MGIAQFLIEKSGSWEGYRIIKGVDKVVGIGLAIGNRVAEALPIGVTYVVANEVEAGGTELFIFIYFAIEAA